MLSRCLDEFGMLGAELLHALLEYIALGRDGVDGFNTTDYISEAFGRIALTIMQGDFMQLEPVIVQGVIDFHREEAKSLEVEEVWGMYQNVKNCIILRECRRFEEPLLEELLDTIRKPTAGERRVRNELWERLEKCYAGADEYMDTDGVDRRFKQAEFLDAVFMSQSWALVAREQQHRIERNAQRRGELVYYIQAVDTCRHHLVRDEYMRALQLQNMTKTARMMGLVGCFKGMRARITKRINPADAIVQDTPVTVLSVAFDP